MIKDITTRIIAGIITAISVAVIWWFWASVKVFLSNALSGIIGLTLSLLSSIGSWMLGSFELPRLVVLILFLCTVAFAWQRFSAWRLQILMHTETEPSFQEFTQFTRWNVIWRWQWNSGAIADLCGFCAICDRRVRYEENGFFPGQEPTEIVCTHCEKVIAARVGKSQAILEDVSEEIDHAVRTEQWRDEVKSR